VQTKNYYDAIKNYNVVAIFSGHNHGFTHQVWNGIDTFNAGLTKYPQFLVVRITDDELAISERLYGSWNRVFQKSVSPVAQALAGDLSGDGKVDMVDMAELSREWQMSYSMDILVKIAEDWLK